MTKIKRNKFPDTEMSTLKILTNLINVTKIKEVLAGQGYSLHAMEEGNYTFIFMHLKDSLDVAGRYVTRMKSDSTVEKVTTEVFDMILDIYKSNLYNKEIYFIESDDNDKVVRYGVSLRKHLYTKQRESDERKYSSKR